MENRITLNQFAIFFGLVLIFISCDTAEKDWKNAKTVNSITEYQKFIKNHTESIYAVNAQNAVDSLEWVAILKLQNVDSLQLFINNHSSSKFLSTFKVAMDSLEWNLAFTSKDTVRLRKYSEKYPDNPNSKKVESLIWKIQWPPATNNFILMVLIWKDGYSDIFNLFERPVDKCAFSNGIPFDGFKMTDNHVVFIWRNFAPNELKKVNKLGLKTGIVYLKTKNGYEFIKHVDLNKSDEELRDEIENFNEKLTGTNNKFFFGVSDKSYEQGLYMSFHEYKKK
jgi:hypothetical protein